jgi:hypothetical protein
MPGPGTGRAAARRLRNTALDVRGQALIMILWIYRVYLKTDKFQESVPYIKTKKKKVDIHMFRNVWFLSLTKCYNYVIFYLQMIHLTYSDTMHIPNLLTAEYASSIKSKFTKNSQNALHLNPYTHGHIWPWAVAHMQRSQGRWKWSDRPKKMCWRSISLIIIIIIIIY